MSPIKIIYGSGRVPKASEFALGEIVINVDDSKAYSKSKTNVVFELGTSGSGTTSSPALIDTGSFYLSSTFENNIITFTQGDGTVEEINLSSLADETDNDWYVDTSNSRLTSSLDVYIDGNITGSSNISASGYVSIDYIRLKDNKNSSLSARAGAIMYSASSFYAGIE